MPIGVYERRLVPPLTRVLQRVKINCATGCWEFEGARSCGYGVVGSGRRRGQTAPVVHVHRLVYEAFVGPVPDGLHIDHLCRIRHCCNPDHLEAVSQGENNRRSWAARKAAA